MPIFASLIPLMEKKISIILQKESYLPIFVFLLSTISISPQIRNDRDQISERERESLGHLTMKGKQHNSFNFKEIFICCFLFFLIFFALFRSTFHRNNSSPFTSSIHTSNSSSDVIQQPSKQTAANACPKLPPSLANALVHYATSNITPQLTMEEITSTFKILENKSPCNLLVFGVGYDSLMWKSLNYGGRTVFLEENKFWIQLVKKQIPSLECYAVAYDTKVRQAKELHETGMKEECRVVRDPRLSKCKLALKSLPRVVYDTEWDVIVVDAPSGYLGDCPGRMGAIYTAGLMARNRGSGDTDVFVHDVNRVVEDGFSKSFLCEGYLVDQVGILRHFNVPSHRSGPSSMPFCP